MKLDQMQRTTMLLSVAIRNAMEDFHVEHLDDQQMMKLNPIIRNAIYSFLKSQYDYTHSIDKETRDRAGNERQFLVMSIPEYWEIPGDKNE